MEILTYLEAIRDELHKNEKKLDELDAAIGDNDHGTNICRGFDEICKKGQSQFTKDSPLGADLKICGLAMMSKTGGSSGALLGNALMKMAAFAGDKKDWKNSDIANLLHAGIAGIQNLGKAVPGEKTLLDAFFPAYQAFENAKDNEPLAFEKAAEEAMKGCEATVPLVATKGRASYLGERSRNHMDPGALSVAIMFDKLKEVK